MLARFEPKMIDWINRMAVQYDCTPEDVIQEAIRQFARSHDLCGSGPKEHTWDEIRIIGVPMEVIDGEE